MPIKTTRFRSNWDLSAARAVTVLHTLIESGELDPRRFVAEGHGAAHPLVPNDSAENRAVNRRVELTISQSNTVEGPTLEHIAASTKAAPAQAPESAEPIQAQPADASAAEEP